MILLQTIGSIDMPGSGARKMPSPRQYVAVVVAWVILEIFAAMGQGARRASTAVGWLLVLTGMVVGPFGQRLVSFLNTVSQEFPAMSAASQSQSSATTTTNGSVSA